MKKISLVQVNYQQGPTNLASFYLPYSIGCVWSYANSHDSIKQSYQLEHVIWQRHDVSQVSEQLCEQHVVGFSTYIWNRHYNFALARRIKQLNPNCFIFFGGPEPAHTDPDIFKKHPYIDAIVVQEGELTVKKLLDNLQDVGSVPGLVYNHQGRAINTGEAERIQDLGILPSPYLTGFFDHIIQNSPEVKEWAAVLETNRGCPYQCTFCDWGSLTYNKVKQFPLERVFADIEWMAKNKIYHLSIADANFGMFVDRDNAIIDKYLEVQAKYGFPQGNTASYAKNQKKEVLSIVEKLVKNSMKFNSGLQISMQTLDDDVLSVIKRKNLNQQNCEEILKEASARNIVVGTELILGLPSDTYEKWKTNYWKLLSLGLHENIDFYISQLLENAEMNIMQRHIYDIRTANIYDYLSGALEQDEPEECKEYIEISIGHADMPYKDWVRSYTFSWFMGTFHAGGLSEYYSRFLRAHQGVSYEIFYNDLFVFLESDPWFMSQIHELANRLDSWISQGRLNYRVHGVKLNGWNLPWFALMKIHHDPMQKHHVQNLLSRYMVRYNLDADVYADLSRLQHSRLIDMHQRDRYPRTEKFDFNLHDCVVLNAPLQRGNYVLEFVFPERNDMTDQEFLERLYFTRRRRFGKTWINTIFGKANEQLVRHLDHDMLDQIL